MKPFTDSICRLTIAAAGAFITLACLAQSAGTQAPVATTTAAKSAIPRMPDGHPDFQGTWFKTTGYQPNGGVILPGGARGAGVDPSGTNSQRTAGGNPFGRSSAENADVFFLHSVKIPYRPEAVQEKRWRAVNEYLDGEPRCHIAGVPRSAEQPPYPHMIIQDDKTITILYEYVHEPRIIPITNSPHPKNFWAWDGDSRAHWEGDTLVVDVTNFNGRSWLDMTGNFVDENLHVVERYKMTGANSYVYEATLTDPTLFSEPFTIRFDVGRQKDADQIIEYSCLEGESDRQHYTSQTGGTKADAGAGNAAGGGAAERVHGCLRGDLVNGAVNFTLETRPRGKVPVSIDAGSKLGLRELVDRDVWLIGKWQGKANQSPFTASAARAQAEGCAWDGKSP